MRLTLFVLLALMILSQHTCSTTKLGRKVNDPEFKHQDTSMKQTSTGLSNGWWLMKMDLGSSKLPVRFSYNSKTKQITIYNAEERIVCDSVLVRADSLIFKAPVFENIFKLKIISAKEVSGYWYNLGRTDYKIACSAKFHSEENTSIIKGTPSSVKYEVVFSANTTDEYKAIGLFNFYPSIELHNANYTPVTGTFLTETGDYRYLEGQLVNNTDLSLSCFDGSHAFLFKAKYKPGTDTLKGTFYSGNHYSEPWLGWQNNKAQLRNPDSLTFLKPGYESVAFSFPSITGTTVSFPSERFKNKVTIVEIMGSWCPNCMDETLFLQAIKNKYKTKGIEIVALCFERTDDYNKSVKSVDKMRASLGADYEFLIAGTSNKAKAIEKLPMLNAISSFPTTIFIDKKGKVRKIYTGYYGPSTGNYHTLYKDQTIEFIEKLLSE